MFAIIQTGGKQYKVTEGLIVKVEKLDKNVGDKVEFDALLIENDGTTLIGTPVVENKKVVGEVVESGKGDKLVIFKYKAKKNVRKKQGHRQPFTAIKINKIG